MSLFKTIILLFLLSPAVFGQTPQSIGYKNDLMILKRSFEEHYPSLYRFNSKASVARVFDQCLREINDNTSERDFYKLLKRILSHMQDGHLSCTAPESLRQRIDEKDKHFPLSLYFTGNKAYAACSNTDDFPAGTEITQINDMSIPVIREELFHHIVSDGKIETKKYWILNHSFWFYFSLVYGPYPEYSITYKNSKGQLRKTQINAALRKDIQCISLTDEDDDPLVDLKFPSQHIALLTIRTFANSDLADAHINFEEFLETAFHEIKTKKTSSLIIDLRGNGGGRDVYGALLYSYLSDTAFRYYQKLETSSKILDEQEHPNLSVQQPQSNSFTGHVYILINGLSFSATSEFCTVVKNNKRAIFIGEETGGTYCGNTSGSSQQTVLPYSQFTVSIPTIRYSMFMTDKKNKDRGIKPEYHITPTIKDLMDKKDVPLDFAMELAEQNSSR